MKRIAGTALVVLLAASCSSGRDERRDRCAKLREHVADLTVERTGSGLPPEEQAKHRANLVASSGEEFVRRCVEEWGDRSIDCALDADGVDAVMKCVAPRS